MAKHSLPGYDEGMNLAPYLDASTLVVFCGTQAVTHIANHLVARLALRGPLGVIDAGNRLQPYRLTRFLREHTPQAKVFAQRIRLQRAFTAHQVVAALETTPALPAPLVVLDLLATFYDETLPLPQARVLLRRSLAHLERLRQTTPLFITVRPPSHPTRHDFLEAIYQSATVIFLDPDPPSVFSQPRLL